MSVSKYQAKNPTLWMVRYRDPNGKQHKQRGFASKKIVELWEAENITSPIIRNNYYDPNAGKKTIGELWPAWIKPKEIDTKRSYHRNLRSIWKYHVEPY